MVSERYISIQKPPDFDGQMDKLGDMMGNDMNTLFRVLEKNDREVFENLLMENGMKLEQYPSTQGA